MQGMRKYLVGEGKKLANESRSLLDQEQQVINGAGKFFGDDVEGRTINNLWTGKGLGSKGKKAAFTAIGGYFGYQAMAGAGSESNAIAKAQFEEGDIQSLPGTQGDGLGYTAYPSANLDMQGLAPSGDLVFALHRLRHGG